MRERKWKRLKKVKVLGELGDLEEIMHAVALSACTGGLHTLSVTTADRAPLMEFFGHVIKPEYDLFEAACRVSADNGGAWEVLYDENSVCTAPYRNKKITTGSMEAVADFVRERAGVRVRVRLM